MMYRAPNESHYLANLNAINPIQTSPGSVSQAFDDSFPNDDDLDIFASTQFFDFDNMAETMVGGGGGGVKEEVAKTTITTIPNNSNVAIATSIGRSGMGYLEDLNDFGFDYSGMLPILPDNQFAPISTAPYQSRATEPTTTTFPLTQQSSSTAAAAASQSKAILPSPSTKVNPTPSSSVTSPVAQALANTLKRKASSIVPVESAVLTPEDSTTALFAAEEDKRRRNTAASARFRVKKKQREQALEVHAKELESKCQALQEKVNQLEMENKWLKDLITDRKDKK